MKEPIAIHRIHWADANYSSGWHYPGEIPTKPVMVESVGWLINENSEAVTLALSVSDHAIGHISVIPKANIVERWCLSDDSQSQNGVTA